MCFTLFIDKMLKNLLKLIFPDICTGCNDLLILNEKVFCTKCKHNLPKTFHHINPTQNESIQKFYGILPIEFCCSFLYFTHYNEVKNLIHHLKYKGKTNIGTELALLYSSDISKIISEFNVDCIVPVPLHSKRLRKRGYNQVETFAQTLANQCNIEYNNSILERKVYTQTQTHKNKQDRQLNKKNVFAVNFSSKDDGKHYLIIDDVLTTGATLEACGKALLEIPNSKISIITMAYTLS